MEQSSSSAGVSAHSSGRPYSTRSMVSAAAVQPLPAGPWRYSLRVQQPQQSATLSRSLFHGLPGGCHRQPCRKVLRPVIPQWAALRCQYLRGEQHRRTRAGTQQGQPVPRQPFCRAVPHYISVAVPTAAAVLPLQGIPPQQPSQSLPQRFFFVLYCYHHEHPLHPLCLSCPILCAPWLI